MSADLATEHELKCWPHPFAAILAETKTFEARCNDRNFQPGDTVHLREWDPNAVLSHDHNDAGWHDHPGDYTGREVKARIGYMVAGPEWGLPSGVVVFSLLNVAQHPCLSCNGDRWVDDEGWQPEDYERAQGRVPGRGRLPCGACNFGGWNEPDGLTEPTAGRV